MILAKGVLAPALYLKSPPKVGRSARKGMLFCGTLLAWSAEPDIFCVESVIASISALSAGAAFRKIGQSLF